MTGSINGFNSRLRVSSSGRPSFQARRNAAITWDTHAGESLHILAGDVGNGLHHTHLAVRLMRAGKKWLRYDHSLIETQSSIRLVPASFPLLQI